jgi:hypothetical protein
VAVSKPSGSTSGVLFRFLLAPPLLLATCLAALAAGAAGCGDSVDDRPAKWSFISATILQPTCATVGCHSELAQKAGVDLHDASIGYKILTDRQFVRPGAPQDSAVIHLMRAQGAIRMPPDFPLNETDIALIERWIAAGAKND